MDIKDYERKVLEMCRDFKTIFIYISKDDEVETRNIIKYLMFSGKRVVVPLSNIEKNEIELSEIGEFELLQKGAYGIDEPKKRIAVTKEDIEIFFVPGRMFDEKGNRKGRGKGYFDRFLEKIKGKKRIVGLCYRHQLMNKLETNEWDIPVDEIILAD